MAVALSSQSPRPPLQPRPVRYEPTPEEAREARRQSIREAIHADLHVLYDHFAATRYDGPLTSHQAVDGAVYPGVGAPLGVELHHLFISYLDKDHPESALGRALKALEQERPNLHQIVWLHLSEELTQDQIGERVHLDRSTVSKRWYLALDVIAGKLGAWRPEPARN